MQHDEVLKEASRVRRALEAADFPNLPYSMGRFPVACCGMACVLLNIHFRVIGLPLFPIVNGMKRGGPNGFGSHAWLEMPGRLVDITADQFKAMAGAPVYVGPITRWHARWKVSHVEQPSEAHLDRLVKAEVWEAVVAKMRAELSQS